MASEIQISTTTRNSNYRELFQRIQRRSGEIVDFDKDKITEAIWKAAQSVGGTDRKAADLLADKVVLYLGRTHEDHLLNIEEVQDAVEKVLIENGHAKTAKAYILYREKRSRIRKFRQQGPEKPLRFQQQPIQEGQVEVLTSGEQLVHWDRNRITEALIRETDLPRETSERIAREVEKQIIYSKTSRLTASLIRELVNVKLLEYGFLKESQLHSRLGIPLFDIEQILQGERPGQKPERLEKKLSGSIIRQYMTGRVFSAEVSEAHLRGELHLHGLTEPWKNTESIQSLEYLKKTGLCFPDFTSRLAPADSAWELIGQLATFNEMLDGALREHSQWEGINIFLAPYLEGCSKEEMHRIARFLLKRVAAFSSNALYNGPVRSLGLYFHIPKSLWETAALGPSARYTGKTYAYYEETARDFLVALLEEISNGDDLEQSWLGVEFCFHFEERFFDNASCDEDISLLQSAVPRMTRWSAWFHSKDWISHRTAHFGAHGGNGPLPAYKYPWKMRSLVGQDITLNLPLLGQKAEGDLEYLQSLIEQHIYLCFTAFRQRRKFIEDLQSRGVDSAVRLLEHRGDGEPFARPSQSYGRISLWGLEELAEWQTDSHTKHDQAYQRFVVQLLRMLTQKVQLSSCSSRIPCEVTLETRPEVAQRFERTSSELSDSLPLGLARAGRSPFLATQWGVFLTGTSQYKMDADDLSEQGDLKEFLFRFVQKGREMKLVMNRPKWVCQSCHRILPGSADICTGCGALQLVPL